MLDVLTQFPQAGSNAFVRETAEPVRILQRLPGKVAVVKLTSAEARYAGASATRREDEANLAETLEEAMGLEPVEIAGRRIRAARKSGPCSGTCGGTIVPGQKFVDGEIKHLGLTDRACIPCARAGLA